jgi:hypothetical protein
VAKRMELDEVEIKRLYLEERWSAVAIAAKMGCEYKAILRRVRGMGLSREPLLPSHLAQSDKILFPGTVYNDRVVLEQSYNSKRRTRQYLVKCLVCESTRTLDYTHVVRNRCRCYNGTYKGKDYPRSPYAFKSMFPQDLCGWVRCSDPTAAFIRGEVDHNHGCTRGHPSNKACRHCVRAYVHHECNAIIGRWDWAHSEGLVIPDDVAAYLVLGS